MFNSDKYTARFLLATAFLLFFPLTTVFALDFNTMLNALSKNTGPIIYLVVAIAYVIGMWFIISAIIELKTVGQSQAQTSQTHGAISGPIIKLVVGVLLLYLPSTVDVGVLTLWGQGAFNSGASILSYTPKASDPFAPAKAGAIAVVRVVGYVSFVRGLVMLSHTSNQGGGQPGTFGKGIAHIIGGILAINIVATIAIISNSLGLSPI